MQSIMEKIDRLKEASGNTDLGFSEHDIDDDFNPEEHDKRMQVELYVHPRIINFRFKNGLVLSLFLLESFSLHKMAH